MSFLYTKIAARAINNAKDVAEELGHGYVGTEHLLLGLLREEGGLASEVLIRHGVTEEEMMGMIEKLISDGNVLDGTSSIDYTPSCRRVLETSKREAARFGSNAVGTEHLLLAIMREGDSVAFRLMNTIGVSMTKLYQDLTEAMGIDAAKARKEFPGSQQKKKSATETLDMYSMDLTAKAREGKLDPLVGRDMEIARVIQIISRRTKNNPCLIGEPGVGKTAIVEGLARRIVQGDVPDAIREKRLLALDLSGMVAGSKYRGEFEERIKKVVKEAVADGNVLLFIDEIHTIVGAGGAEGALDASNILKPSLARGEIQVIGATTIEEYRKYIEKDAALERRFQPVVADEPTEAEAVEILKGLRRAYEKHHGVTITDDALEAAVKMSVRYINDRFLPDKAIDLIDEASSKIRLGLYGTHSETKAFEDTLSALEKQKEEAIVKGDLEKARAIKEEQKGIQTELEVMKVRLEKKRKRSKLIVDSADVAAVVSEWTKIPVKQLEEAEVSRLKRLETTLHKRVVGQDEAVVAVSKAIRRGRVGMKDPKRPIGSFLFLGPTGVGKTELSKALAEAMFGDENSIIRVDMSEYMEKHSVSKLIGSPPGYVGYDEGGQVSEKVRRNPYSILLFDEIEKAHPDVFNILLQVLDDGHITDSQGRKVDFKNTIIIMTSNAGAANIVAPKKLGFTPQENAEADYQKMKAGVMEEVKQLFKPEFLNRIDDIIVFHPLSKENIKSIVGIMLSVISKRTQAQLGITISATEGVKAMLAEAGFDPIYGARPLKREIQNKVEDGMAEEILYGRIKTGDHVRLKVNGKDIKFSIE